ncbi:unnamed protein product [Clonostachys rosea]|uniref:Methyltransferase domain-containing protein n=1 Tax=Bionectria ochroleuca TaxID=29856 RepID=A0ABY6V450_BIOOC|nr:unnamed protein product [Clonostachys rosea]
MADKTEFHAVSSGDNYVFTRDFLDNNRQDDLCVADVGTGTGQHGSVWLFDVREKLAPTARLVGLDISFDATPPVQTLPSNVTLRHWSVKEDVPEDLIGVFDIVHVRFFSFVLLVDDVPSVIDRLYKMLKGSQCVEPGGYLQWGDPDVESIRIDKANAEAKTESLAEMFKLLAVQDPRLKPTWVTNLPDLFSAAGFVDIEVDKNDCPPHWAYLLHECGLMIHELIYRKTKNEKMQQELGRLLPLAVEETRTGAYVTAVRWTVVGKKPAP